MRLRILFCTLGYYPAAAGGAERQARLQAEELVRRGHRVTVVCPATPGVSAKLVDGVRVVRLPTSQRRRPGMVIYLFELAAYLLVQSRSFDLIHVHLANLQADVAVIAAGMMQRPVYVKVAAGGELGEVGRFRRLSTLTRYVGLRHAARVQAISDEIEHDLIGIGVEAARIVRNPNGIDLASIGKALVRPDASARDSLGIPTAAVFVLYVGRFAGYKGIDDLLAAWRGVVSSSARLALVGATAMERMPTTSSMDNVSVYPWTRDIGTFYRAADVFVLPSHSEGMSNALLEAMASGLACIATRVGAAESMIVDGVDGLLVDPFDRHGLGLALQRLISDAEMRKRLGSAAAETVRARYGIGSVVDRIEIAYGEMVASR